MATPFNSPRLLYRAWDWPADEAYIAKRQLDVAGQANISSFLLRPGSKSDLEGLKKWNEAALLAVVICLPAASETEAPVPIGDITLAGGDARLAHHRTKDIGVRLLPEFQGMGYGSEAIEWITDWGFRFGGLHRIGIGGFSYNKRATDLYERLGFIPEGRSRQSIWYDGGWHDVVLLAILEDEWKALKEKKLKELEKK